VILLPVALLLHNKLPLQLLAVNTLLSPLHKLFFVAAIVGLVGLTPTLISMPFEAVLVPHSFLQLAVYVPAVLTSITLPLALFDQIIVASHPVAVNLAFAPSQHTVLSLVILGAFGVVPFLIVITSEATLVPQLVVHLALYVPALLTLITLPVALLLHVIVPLQFVAVKVAVCASHKSVLSARTIGAAGGVPCVMVNTSLLAVPQMVSHVTW
jgi:hypothetical protein